MDKFKVCVLCSTYNQAQYIESALDGFTIQQTTFPYVCVVMDDCSTDGEQKVIQNYLDNYFDLFDTSVVRKEETDDYVMTFAQHKENKNCHFAVYFLKYNHRNAGKRKDLHYAEWNNAAKYIATCEGDDYWTLPTKLQMQYDYLESHPDVVLSCHRYNILDVSTEIMTLRKNIYFDQSHRSETEFEFDLRYYLSTWVTKTLTNMYRRDAIKSDYYVGYKYARDVHFNYYVMTKGHGVCHSFIGGVYRSNVSTSIFGNLSGEAKVEINSKVYEELAEVTNDPLVRQKANRLILTNCKNRLSYIGGGISLFHSCSNSIGHLIL